MKLFTLVFAVVTILLSAVSVEAQQRSYAGSSRGYGDDTEYIGIDSLGRNLVLLTDKQKLHIPQFCRLAPEDRICTEGKVKFNIGSMRGPRNLIQRTGAPVNAYVVSLDEAGNPTGRIDEKGPVTEHDNFFDEPIRINVGRQKLVLRNGSQYFSTELDVRSEYEQKLDPQKISLSASRFVLDPNIGVVIQQRRVETEALTYAQWVSGQQ